jgi:hypothetical protein
MSYPVFLIILIGGAVASVLLAALKIVARFKISWFEVPFPFLLAAFALSAPYLWLVIAWHDS